MSATDHTLTDARTWVRRVLTDPAFRVGPDARREELVDVLAARFATAEADKEALRAERDRLLRERDNIGCSRFTCADDLSRAKAERHAVKAEVDDLRARLAKVEALADECDRRCDRAEDRVLRFWVGQLRALLTTDHAVALRAREAKVLREAADDLLQVGLPSPSRREVHVWLRARADSIEQERTVTAEAALAGLVAGVTRALDDEEANLADDGARLSHSVVRRLRALLREAKA